MLPYSYTCIVTLHWIVLLTSSTKYWKNAAKAKNIGKTLQKQKTLENVAKAKKWKNAAKVKKNFEKILKNKKTLEKLDSDDRGDTGYFCNTFFTAIIITRQ